MARKNARIIVSSFARYDGASASAVIDRSSGETQAPAAAREKPAPWRFQSRRPCRFFQPAALAITIVVTAAVVLLTCGTRRASADEESARRLLGSRGLVPVGNLWMLKDDVAVRRKLDLLDQSLRLLQKAIDKAEELVAENEKLGAELQRATSALDQLQRQAARAGNDNSAERAEKERLQEQVAKLQQRVRQLEQLYLPPQKFCEHPDSRATVIAINAARHRIAASLTELPSRIFTVENDYTVLRKDPDVMAAIALLGPKIRLASGTSVAKNRQRLGRAERAALGDWVPVYAESGRIRVAAIVEGRAPTTLTYQPGSGPTLLPDSVVQKAGIEIPANAPVALYEPGDGRRIPVRVITVRYLRLGETLLEDVEAYALPPEGEDLGGRITDESLGRYTARLDLARLRMQLAP
jgi:hypothetical protein